MALIVKDRVKETTTTTGTGTITLAGAVDGFQAFSVIGDGNTTYYCITDGSGNNAWEVGIGTFTASGSTLARTTILSSSNSGNAITLGTGTHNVFTTYSAEKSSFNDSGIELPYTVSGDTIVAGNGVGLNSDGTVSKIKETTSYNTVTSTVDNAGNNNTRILGYHYKEDEDLVVIFFRDANNYPSAIAGTVNNLTGAITWGTKIVCSSNTCYTNDGYQVMCTGTHSGTFKYFYTYNRDSFYTRIWSGWFTASGNTLTMMSGSEYQMSSFGNQTSSRLVISAFDEGQGVLLAQYQTYQTGGQVYYNLGWLQPTSTTLQRWGGGAWGYEQQAGGYTYNQMFMWFDKNANRVIQAYTSHSTNEVVVERADSGGYYTYGWQYDTAITSYSGTSTVISVAYNDGISRSIVNTIHGSSPYELQTTMLELASSGSSWVTQTHNNTSLFPSGLTWSYSSMHRNWLSYLNDDGKVYQAFKDTTDSNKWKVCAITCNVGSGFSSSVHEITSQESDMVSTSWNYAYLYLKGGYDFVSWLQTSSYDIESYSGKSETTSNIADYHGLAINGNTAGNTVRVSINGSINNSQTGLTQNTPIYIANDGTIGASGELNIGTAMSATSVRLHAPNASEISLVAGEDLTKGQAVGVGSAGTGFLAKNIVSSNLNIGDQENIIATADLGTINSQGNQGSAYIGNNKWVITYINSQNYISARVIELVGGSYTLHSELVLYSSSNGSGGDVDVGKKNDGTQAIGIGITRYNTDSGQLRIYTLADDNTLTLQETKTISSSYCRNDGNNNVCVVKWVDCTARTVSGNTTLGSFIFLTSYAGVQWYDSSYAYVNNCYFSGSDYTIGSTSTTFSGSGIQYHWNIKAQVAIAEDPSRPYVYVAMPQYFRTGDWGIQKIYWSSDTSHNMGTTWSVNATNDGNQAGLGLFTRMIDTGGAEYCFIYLFARTGTKVMLQVYQNPDTSTTGNSACSTSGSVVDIQDSLNSGGMQPLDCFYDTQAEKAILVYGNYTGTDGETLYGKFETSSSSPYYTNPSNYTDSYNTWGREGGYRITFRFANGDELNNTRSLYSIFNDSSYGYGKMSYKAFGILRENYADNFIGIAQSDVTATNSVTVKTLGAVDSNQVGLTTGQLVALNKTTGAISTTQAVGSGSKEIGVSTGTSKFLIKG